MIRPQCNYCHSEGVMKAIRETRAVPVPPGAKDLKLTYIKERIVWQCPRCDNYFSSLGTSMCKCGTQGLEPDYIHELPNAPVLLYKNADKEWWDPDWASCTNCYNCVVCETPLQTRHYTTFKMHPYGLIGSFSDFYMHPGCAKPGNKKFEELKRMNAEHVEGCNREKKGLCRICGKAFTLFNRKQEHSYYHRNCHKKEFSW